MSVSPVARSVSSAAYGFVRFIGGGLAPYVAGQLVERFNPHVPFLLAALVVLAGVAVVWSLRRALARADTFGHLARSSSVAEQDRSAPADAILAEELLV